MKRGIWIAFEGGDGAGKTTQLKKVSQYLREKGLKVLETREPGGNEFSEKLRGMIFDPILSDDPITQLLLFVASRRRNILEVVLPALERGEIVLSDRCELSTFAYQHFEYGLDFKDIKKINDYGTDNIHPDLVILYDLNVKEARKRIEKALGNKKNFFDKAKEESWEKRRKGYLKMAKQFKNIKIVDATFGEEEVFEKTIEIISSS